MHKCDLNQKVDKVIAKLHLPKGIMNITAFTATALDTDREKSVVGKRSGSLFMNIIIERIRKVFFSTICSDFIIAYDYIHY